MHPNLPIPPLKTVLSDKVHWDPSFNKLMTIGSTVRSHPLHVYILGCHSSLDPFRTPCNVANFIQKFFPPSVTVYDILQFLLAERSEFIEAQKEEERLPKLYTRIRSLLFKLELLMARLIEPFNFHLSNYRSFVFLPKAGCRNSD
ncbi:hypothetical protein PM082_009570 [Marasmius tenuissimus]|nr:hypothetical protein PM082_009570 [Marasmius tenuissimus]